ncbi:hypothetical protein [Nocardia sp. CDC160]|uniref:hypothetical protein n=1 Tax=Nocardia sp. CDC160 TaxID=3112166 RepID=UPI002DBF751D|nr:hypothetical protein [Nocardia sp. CDC160]MEC3918602.1 hypothetical protein [Nocardia sp. CDC160]
MKGIEQEEEKGPGLRAGLETTRWPLVAAQVMSSLRQGCAAIGTVGNQAVSSFLLVTTIAVV